MWESLELRYLFVYMIIHTALPTSRIEGKQDTNKKGRRDGEGTFEGA